MANEKPIIDITPDPHPESLTLDKLRAAEQLIEDLGRGMTDEIRFANAKDVSGKDLVGKDLPTSMPTNSFRCVAVTCS